MLLLFFSSALELFPAVRAMVVPLLDGFLKAFGVEVVPLIARELSHHVHGLVLLQANATVSIVVKLSFAKLDPAQRCKQLLHVRF